MTRSVIWLLAGGLLMAGGPAGQADSPPHVHRIQVLSPPYAVDRIYRSMEGPQSMQPIRLLEGPPELVWIVGYEAVMVGPDGETPAPQDFMCHSNLDFGDVIHHNQRLQAAKAISPRLFTLSQGQLKIRFPDGFGIPVWSDEPLHLTTQVLNLNRPDAALQVRHKITIELLRDREAPTAMRPLFSVGAYGLALLEGSAKDAYFGVDEPTPAQHGSSCLLGTNAATHTYRDPLGRSFTGHWVVPPGRQENRTLVTKIMNLPFDTTLHYAAVHLHPFAESLELRDLTTKQTVFASQAKNFADRIGLDTVEAFSSPEGVPLIKDHEYELVSVYNNTTAADQDSMAVMYLYLLDKEFQPANRQGS